MALKGTLKDFSVADIFQLIGQQGKSGSLYVRTKEKEAHIVFDGGKVVLGTFKKSDEEFLLGTMLLRSAVITADQLAHAVEIQKTTLRSLGDILKSEGMINSATLSEFISLQLREVLFRLFQWKDGLYEFVAEKIQYNKAIIKPQAAEAVLMDGFRMLDEWPHISEKVGSVEGVYTAKVSLASLATQDSSEDFDLDLDSAFSDGDFSGGPKKNSAPKQTGFTIEEKRVLEILDGKRSLQEVIYLTRLGTFEALKAVSSLLERNVVEKTNEFMPTRIDFSRHGAGPEKIGAWILRSFRPLLAIFIISLFLPVVAFGLKSHWSSSYRNEITTSLSIKALKEKERRQILIGLIEIYRLQNGDYPKLLEELQKPMLSNDWDYERKGTTFVLNRRVTGK